MRIIARYITNLMIIFGCIRQGDEQKQIGFISESSTTSGNIEEREQIVFPFIQSMAKLRDEIRNIAKDLKNKQLFSLSDHIRDDLFPGLGVRMEDYETSTGEQLWRLKLVDRNILLQERKEKLEREELAKRMAAEAKLKKKENKTEPPVDPRQMFRLETEKYSQFDENGLPTHDHEGQELTKSALKKIAKRFQAQEKKYNDYLKTLNEQN